MQAGGTVLVTGATSGIGLATARVLAPRVDRLLVHGPEAADDVGGELAELRGRLGPGASLAYLRADYTRLAEVVRLADGVLAAVDRLDVVVNNAGLPGAPSRTMSPDGNELTLQVDYLAPVALTALLLPRLAEQDRARVVDVASATHLSATLDLDDLDLDRRYTPVAAYSRAKLALVVHACWLAAHVPHTGVEVVSLHPGVISTDLLHSMFGIGGDTPEHAARAVVAVTGRSGDGGTYYDEDRPAAPHPDARDPGIQARLRELTIARLARAGIELGPPWT